MSDNSNSETLIRLGTYPGTATALAGVASKFKLRCIIRRLSEGLKEDPRLESQTGRPSCRHSLVDERALSYLGRLLFRIGFDFITMTAVMFCAILTLLIIGL